ncbi:hypothetical protein [Flavobacterium sp.]|uniref:hypothetical protein n=1 Tax=Flavobacterium sp. TaxID=239 RepID=UPI003BDAC253
MKKLVFGLIATVMMSSNSFSQKTILGNFTATEIGYYHNQVLNILSKNDLLNGSPEKIKELLSAELPKIDKRFMKSDIVESVDNLYLNTNFNTDLLINKNLLDYQANVLNVCENNKTISTNVKDLIITNSKDIININRAIDSAVKSNFFSQNDKVYLQAYQSIYNNSNEYWNSNGSTGKWQAYAADAVAGICGLYGGPVWSIVQGAIVSAAFDW